MNHLQQNAQQREKHLQTIQKQMQGLKNEMEFVEILAQFWPLPNMSQKMERLEARLHELSALYQHQSQLKAS
jgi:hypothetical protein